MNQTLTELPTLKSATVKMPPLTVADKKSIKDALAIIEVAEEHGHELREKLKRTSAEVGAEFARGKIDLTTAAAALSATTDADRRRETADALRAGCKAVIAAACDAARPAVAAFHRNKAEALRAEAQRIEDCERQSAEGLGQDPEAFMPSELLQRVKRTHTVAIQRAKSIEEGQRINISELRELGI